MSEPASAPPSTDEPTLRFMPGALAMAAALAIVFLAQAGLQAIDTPGISRMGARTPWVWEQDQWWTLLSSTFLHLRVWHVLANAAFALVVGSLVERQVGAWRMWLIFLVGGITGNALSAALNPDAIGVGASGGNWGLMIAELLLVLLPALRAGTERVPWSAPILGLIALNVAVTAVPGLDGLAHLAGGLGGAATLLVTHVASGLWPWVAVAAMAAHAGALVYSAQQGQPWQGRADLTSAPIARTFFDGLVQVELPDTLPLDSGPVVTYAGEVWYHGISANFLVAHGDNAGVPTLEETEALYAAEVVGPLDCSERCTGRWARFEGGELYGAARAYGSVWLVTVVVLGDPVDDEARRWAEGTLTKARFTDDGVNAVDAAAWDLEQEGDIAGAIAVREALVADHPEEDFVLDQLAWTYATHPDGELRDGQRSETLARQAVAVERSGSHVHTLAAALAEQGRFEEAVVLAQEALALVPDDPELAGHLESLQAGEAIRD